MTAKEKAAREKAAKKKATKEKAAKEEAALKKLESDIIARVEAAGNKIRTINKMDNR